MTKVQQKIDALRLRKEGYTYTDIRQRIGVSKSILSNWLFGVKFIPNSYTKEKIIKARLASVIQKRLLKKESFELAEKQAIKDVGSLSERDIFMLGIGIYIGEGTKDDRTIRLINADPKIIKFAIKWLKLSCGLTNRNFRLRIHMYPDTNEKECLSFWANVTKIPLSQFHKTQIDTRLGKKKSKIGKLPHGTAHLSVYAEGNKNHGVFLARRIKYWIREVLK